MGGGLSQPVLMYRGIRQGCSLSGQLFSLAIEPLLCQLRKNLQGCAIKGFENRLIKISAYADDITVFIKNKRDVEA